jgi:hypothetical protein
MDVKMVFHVKGRREECLRVFEKIVLRSIFGTYS